MFDITADMQESAQENYNQLAKIIGLVQRIDRAADQPMGGAPEGTATSGEPLAAGDAGNSKHTTGKTRYTIVYYTILCLLCMVVQ